MSITVRRAETEQDVKTALALRVEVFVDEQGFPLAKETDATDKLPTTQHVLAFVDGTPVGTLRLYATGDKASGKQTWHLGRLVVLKRFRSHGIGRKICTEAHEMLRQQGAPVVEIRAQQDKRAFYERLGYVCHDETPIDEEGVPHINMELKLL
ncbi:hypothetical protein RI367_004265 [Sorochytrium milnesiophthora]